MNLRKITPKFIRRILVLREYRMTKAFIKYLKDPKDGRLVIFEDLLKNHNEDMIRPKSFYEAWVKKYRDDLTQYEGQLIDLEDEMRELGVKLEK